MAADYRIDNLQWALGTVIFIAITSLALGYCAQFIARLRGLSAAEQRKTFWGFVFAGPWITGFIIFVVGPTAASLYYSFTDYKLGQDLDWVGLDNYRRLLLVEGAHGRQFAKAMLNSFYYALLGVPLQISAALFMAMLLNNELPGIRIFRMIFYMPVILAGGPALLLAWRYLLSPNGGFVNESLQRFAGSFFVFDYLYRGFIFIMEGFNGFYTGIARSDPIGPLKYTIPALFGTLILLTLLGDWSDTKRVRAWRVGQVIGLVILYRLMYQGLVQQPVDPNWAYFWAIAITTGILTAAWSRRRQVIRGLVAAWQVAGLLGTLMIAGLVIYWAGSATSQDALAYLVPLAVTLGLIGVSFAGEWSRAKFRILTGAVIVLSAILFVRLIPGQLDGGRLNVITHYLSFGSTLKTTADADYLTDVYPYETMSSLWIYGSVVALMGGLAWLNGRYPRAQRVIVYGTLVVFAVFTLSSFLDGRTYFNAFNAIAQEAGRPNYHFALFNQATDEFPDSSRVPLWTSNELWSKPALILIMMWSSGQGMLIFLAALKGVPRSMYEAAEVDGANVLQRFFRITLPMISPAMFYNIVIGVIAALQTFENVYIFQTPTTEDSISSVAYTLYVRTFRQLAISEGAAMSWILVVIILTLTVMQFRFSKNWVHYGA